MEGHVFVLHVSLFLNTFIHNYLFSYLFRTNLSINVVLLSNMIKLTIIRRKQSCIKKVLNKGNNLKLECVQDMGTEDTVF